MSSWNDVTKKVREMLEKISHSAVAISLCGSSGICPFAVLCDPGVYPSGGTFVQRFTGLAILITELPSCTDFSVSTSLALVVLILPVALMCCRSSNVKFTVFSLLQVFFASFFLKVCHYTPLF